MKRTSFFAKTLLGAAVVTMSLGTVSCKDKSEAVENAEEQNEQKFDDTAQDHLEDDSEFVVMAAEVDMKEIELGKLAQQKAADAEVKAYGQMMVDNHTKSSQTTKDLAQRKNITIPMGETEKITEAKQDLQDKTGKDFDEAYIDMMVDSHEKTIDKMERASENAKDADIRMWAANMLPTLRTHLDEAKRLNDKLDNNNSNNNNNNNTNTNR